VQAAHEANLGSQPRSHEKGAKRQRKTRVLNNFLKKCALSIMIAVRDTKMSSTKKRAGNIAKYSLRASFFEKVI